MAAVTKQHARLSHYKSECDGRITPAVYGWDMKLIFCISLLKNLSDYAVTDCIYEPKQAS